MALAVTRDAVRPHNLDGAAQPRTWPLFGPEAQPQSWNERLADGEFAVLYSDGAPLPNSKSPHDIPRTRTFSTPRSPRPRLSR